MPRRENHAHSQAGESTDTSIRHNVRERAPRAVERPRNPEPNPRENLHAALAERAASYSPGMTVERMGRLGNSEQWTITGVDQNGSVYLVEEPRDGERSGAQRHAMLHGTEIALEERAAIFGPTLAEAWTPVFDAKMVTLPDHVAERTAGMIGKNRADILFLAAERMAANPAADPSAELLRAIDDVVSEIAANAAEGPRVVVVGGDQKVDPAAVRLFDRKERRLITLAEDESLLSHLRFGDPTEITDEPSDGSLPPGDLTEVGVVKNAAMLRAEQVRFGVTSEETARARARVAETLISAPTLRAEILDGLIEIDLQSPRAIETIDADINVLEGDISTLERAWKLHGKGDKHLPEVAAHFARVHALRQYEKSLFAERRAASEQKQKHEQAHALADVKNLWTDTLIAIDAQKKKDQSISLLFRRDLELGVDPQNVIGSLEHILSTEEFDALPPSERRGCMTLLRSLRKQHFSELIPDRKEATSTVPETGEMEIDDGEDEPVLAATAVAPQTPTVQETKARHARRATRGARTTAVAANVIPFPSPAESTPPKKRQRMEDRFAAAVAAREKLAPPSVKKTNEPTEKKDFYQPPTTVEKNYIPYPQVFPPVRDTVTDLDAWAAVGDREAATTEGMAAVRITEPFRKLANIFGGPEDFMSLHAEARAKTKEVHFTLEDLRNANFLQRWLYKRQMQNAVKELLRQEAEKEAAAQELKEARKRRGPLMS